MLYFLSQVSSFVVATSKDLKHAVLRNRIDRNFEAAKARIISPQKTVVSDASEIRTRQLYLNDLSVRWQNVIDLSAGSKELHEQRLERLEEEVVEKVSATGDWITHPDALTSRLLQVPRVQSVRLKAEQDLNKLLLKGEVVPQAKLSGVYQQSDQHLQDQLINTLMLTVKKDGALEYRARGRDEGGRFRFEKYYMDPSSDFKKQAKNVPADPAPKGAEDRSLPFAFRFLDQVRVPATSSAKLQSAGAFGSKKNDSMKRVLLKFAGDVQGVPRDEDESGFRDLPCINNYPGTSHIQRWLSAGDACQISVGMGPTFHTVVQTKTIEPTFWDGLAECGGLDGVKIAKGAYEIDPSTWFSIKADAQISKKGLDALDDLIARTYPEDSVDEAKQLDILGLADSRGNARPNLDLSKRRAETMKDVPADQKIGLSMISLLLGEAGWLTDAGRPERENDDNHRSAAVYLCPATLPADGAAAEGNTR